MKDANNINNMIQSNRPLLSMLAMHWMSCLELENLMEKLTRTLFMWEELKLKNKISLKSLVKLAVFLRMFIIFYLYIISLASMVLLD